MRHVVCSRMNAALGGAIALFLVSALRTAAQPAPEGAANAIVLTTAGKVETASRDNLRWHPARTNQVLHVGDKIRTDIDSQATVRLSDLSVMRVDELTTLEIQPPEQAGRRAAIGIGAGTAYFFDRDKPSETQFRAPSASGAVRGTEFTVQVATNGATQVALLDGEVDLTNAAGALRIHSGELASAAPGQAMVKSPLIDTVNVVQWTLYYPAVLDPDELEWDAASGRALALSLADYRAGDLRGALEAFPSGRVTGSEAETVYHAALLLSTGAPAKAVAALSGNFTHTREAALAAALKEMAGVVQGRPGARPASRKLATELMAGSYRAQAERDLDAAVDMAREAAEASPKFGFARERLAELAFANGATAPALVQLNAALDLSPRNAQALALKGFALAAQKKMTAAAKTFDQAIAVDGALGNAWLGRGLIKIHAGQVNEGRRDLETAAALEPNRAFLRSYLAKGWSLDRPFQYTWNTHEATNELRRAMSLDPKDPTAWLYAALLNDQCNQINDAVRDLEHSEDLNNNRALYRSKFLLDQDQAVRRANLALIYRDAGFDDVALREATRSLGDDYANFAAHLFLSDAYAALQDPKREDLRYQTPWEDELLTANLLAPLGAGVLSENISQQEYSSLFEADHFGISSDTEYFSRGAWKEDGSQYGVSGPMAYSVDAYYLTDPGWRPNNNLDNSDFSAKIKYQLSPKDTAFLEVEHAEILTGDPFQYYNYNTPASITVRGYDPTLKEYEEQDPNLILGYHRDWGAGNHTLFLYRGLQDHFSSSDQNYFVPVLELSAPPVFNPFSGTSALTVQRTTELNSFELQHIYETETAHFIAGARYQNESMETASTLSAFPAGTGTLFQPYLPADTTHFDRLSAYAYYQLQAMAGLRLTGGIAYDYEHFPLDLASPPLTTTESSRGKLSPKAGLDWRLPDGTRVRGAFSTSLGGLINDASTTIEPTEIAGFNQSFRSLIPQSSGFGTPPALRFESFGLAVDHKFDTGTYVDAEAQVLSSEGNQLIGAFTGTPSLTLNDLSQFQYFQEKDVFLSVNQMIGRYVSAGARYTLTAAEVTVNDTSGVTGATYLQNHENSTLNEFSFFVNAWCPTGFFARAEANWWMQHNAYNSFAAAGAEPGADFWQVNLMAGYRFPRRHVELQAGVLNLLNQGYNVDPITYFIEQARTRTFAATLKFNF